MAFGATSAVFACTVSDIIANLTAMDWDSDTVKAALFNNSITPDKTVASASAAYNAGVWTTGNEITDSTDIPAGGLTLGTKTNTASSGNCLVGAANTASGASADGTTYGCLVYSDTIATPVAKQAYCYNSFNAAVTVTAGTLTIVWDPTNKIMKFAC